jgi:hypothetical protein
MQDVPKNLNRKKRGFKFSTNSKSFLEAIKVYSSCHMCDLFLLNYMGPLLSTTKKENWKGIMFVFGEQTKVLGQLQRSTNGNISG